MQDCSWPGWSIEGSSLLRQLPNASSSAPSPLSSLEGLHIEGDTCKVCGLAGIALMGGSFSMLACSGSRQGPHSCKWFQTMLKGSIVGRELLLRCLLDLSSCAPPAKPSHEPSEACWVLALTA